MEGFKHHLKNKAIEQLDDLTSTSKREEKIDNQIQVGDTVRIKSLGKIGKVKDIKGNKCVIESSNNTMKVSLS